MDEKHFEMVSAKMLLKYLGISRSSLQNYDRQGILKAYYLGGKKYYRRDELLDSFESHSEEITD